MMRSPLSQRGFTLLEMMLALALFSLLSLAGWQMLQSMLRGQEQTIRLQHSLGEVERLFALLEQDLQHAFIPIVLTPVVGEPSFAAEEGEVLLRLMRRNWLNPQSLPRANIQQVVWRYSEETLTRQTESKLHFSGISSLNLRFYSAGRWQEQWHARFTLPVAIEVSIGTKPWGTITRIFALDSGI